MTDEREQGSGDATKGVTAGQAPVSLSRRLLLQGATAAVPTILTLQSGAALANSSNGWTGGSSGAGGTGETVMVNGKRSHVCLATDNGQTSGAYQLTNPNGNPATVIPAGVKFKDPDAIGGPKKVYGDDMCRLGGSFEVEAGKNSKKTVYVRRGMLLSTTAYTSLAASGVVDPIDVFKTTL